ncbi:hypothetical protein ES705_32616 [subsurface metagenome]
MVNDRITYNLVSIHPSQITVSRQVEPRYYSPINPELCNNVPNKGSVNPLYHSPIDKEPQPAQFLNNSHNGIISSTTRRKISRALDYLSYIAKHQHTTLTLITLTLSHKQIHADRELKYYLFKPFLAELKRKWKVEHYLDRYEKQKNGNLHIHIVVPKYIYWNEIRNVWNRIQQNLGYVTRYRADRKLWHRDGFRYDPNDGKGRSRKQQYKAYRQGLRTDWDNPNSTDIRRVDDISNVKGYLMKYMTKNPKKNESSGVGPDDLLQVEGHMWGCSVNLSSLKGGQAEMDSGIEQELDKIVASPKTRVFHEDFYHVYSVHADDLEALGCPLLLSIFREMLFDSFPGLSPPELF